MREVREIQGITQICYEELGGGGRYFRKVEIIFAYMSLYMNYLSQIWRKQERYEKKSVCMDVFVLNI